MVADAGPLIALARLNLLGFLPQLFSQVLVTDSVLKECTRDKKYPEYQPIRHAVTQGYLDVVKKRMPRQPKTWQLDAGETSVIALAQEHGTGVLIDDGAARSMARKLGLPLIGTCGVLLLAKEKRLVDDVAPLLDRLVSSGYFLGNQLRRTVLQLAGED